MIDEFIQRLMAKLNTVITSYYEEAPKNAVFPYAVVPTISVSDLGYGLQCLFDVEVYKNELSNVDLEKKCDSIRTTLDNYSEKNSVCGFHIGFDGQFFSRQNEQDLTMRRLTFIGRIF